jgi:hypothetical protein
MTMKRNYKIYGPEKFSTEAKKMLYSFRGCPKCGSEDIQKFESLEESHEHCRSCDHRFHFIPMGDWEEDVNQDLVCVWRP